MREDSAVYTAEVARTAVVTPQMLRITLRAARTESGERFVSSGLADEFFGLWLTAPDGTTAKRYYSVREWRPDTDELDIDFVVHAHGPATRWARGAKVGDRVAFDTPRGHYAPPAETRCVLLVGDATALPAIGRILDERGAEDPPVRVILSVEDPQDRQEFRLRADDEVRWVPAAELVAEAVSEMAAAPTETYLWFSGETTAMRAVRREVRHTLGWPKARYMTMGYWRRDEERWVAEFRRQPGLEGRIAAIWESGADDEAQRDQVDELLTRHGL